VIKEPDVRRKVIEQAYKALKMRGVAYFQIYEGDVSSRPCKTTKGFQMNCRASSYIREFHDVFHGCVNQYSNILVMRK